MRKLNWQIWIGFLLSLFAFISYPFVFVRFPVTRDFPWANLLLFGVAAVLLLIGVRRAFAPGRSRPTLSKIAASILATVSVVILGLFVFSTFIMARWMPASRGAPQVGQKAPDFRLADTDGKLLSLVELLSAPIDSGTQPTGAGAGRKPKGVLLIFYRGYW